MKLIIDKNREVYSAGTWGTKNENNYEILDFEFPEELEEYNKRIVYYLGDEKVWDAIVNNKAILTNAITTKGSVKAYVWLTKTDSQYETDVDFRTQLFEMNFYENENASGIVPTEQQVDGFNTMLTAMNAKIDEVDALETTIETAEAERQEAEATRVSNESTRESNESTRQTNEETRQTQEADRERRTDEAIADIEDKTAEYNANAEAKTTAFNNNATQKTNDFNSNYTQKVNDFNTNATSKTNEFNSNASSKTTTFNDNATSKTNTFNSNASSKTTDFNTNAENKTSAFNTNASDKTTAFDNNASSKTSDFNTNAESKTNTFNDNATQKTTDFNNNAQEKIDEYDEHIVEYQAQIDELQEEVEELSKNMPWHTTEQGTEITVDDAAKYSRNKLELFGNTEQDNTKITYKCDGTETGDYYLTCNSTDYYFTMPTIAEGDILVFNTTDLKLYLGDTEITTESTGTGTNLTFIPSPNPDYPQDIHVVSGENIIGVQGKNLLPANQIRTDKDWLIVNDDGSVTINYPSGNTLNQINLFSTPINIPESTYRMKIFVEGTFRGGNLILQDINGNWGNQRGITDGQLFSISSLKNMQIWAIYAGTNCTIKFELEEGTTVPTEYHPYYHADYPINLGSIELCKIEDYQDEFFKNEPNNPHYDSLLVENGWYKNEIIKKFLFKNAPNESWGTWRRELHEYQIQTDIQDSRPNGTWVSALCDKFKNVSVPGTQMKDNEFSAFSSRITGDTNYLYFRFKKDPIDNLDDFKIFVENNNLLVYTILDKPVPVQITDTTLISQLDEIYEHLKLVKGTNNITVTAEDLAPYMQLTYMQDLPTKLDNLDSRLSLLE